MRRKLCLGGGQVVAHSSDEPYPHGSLLSTFGDLRVIQTFIANGIIDIASRVEPSVETIFIQVKPSVAR
jgi:hypothetical protein